MKINHKLEAGKNLITRLLFVILCIYVAQRTVLQVFINIERLFFFFIGSVSGAYEYLTKKDNGRNTDVSRLFIYYNARAKASGSSSVSDTGCSMTDTIEALEEFGACLESIWPYDISNVNTRPDDRAYQQAAQHKISEALQVNVDLNEMKSCLAQGFPIAFGLKLFSSFDKAAQTGIVPMPGSRDGGRRSDGK